jgi:hypothetical protein
VRRLLECDCSEREIDKDYFVSRLGEYVDTVVKCATSVFALLSHLNRPALVVRNVVGIFLGPVARLIRQHILVRASNSSAGESCVTTKRAWSDSCWMSSKALSIISSSEKKEDGHHLVTKSLKISAD